jgi:hypothetical protein
MTSAPTGTLSAWTAAILFPAMRTVADGRTFSPSKTRTFVITVARVPAACSRKTGAFPDAAVKPKATIPRTISHRFFMKIPPKAGLHGLRMGSPHIPVTARWTKARAVITRKRTTAATAQARPAWEATPIIPPVPEKKTMT